MTSKTLRFGLCGLGVELSEQLLCGSQSTEILHEMDGRLGFSQETIIAGLVRLMTAAAAM